MGFINDIEFWQIYDWGCHEMDNLWYMYDIMMQCLVQRTWYQLFINVEGYM